MRQHGGGEATLSYQGTGRHRVQPGQKSGFTWAGIVDLDEKGNEKQVVVPFGWLLDWKKSLTARALKFFFPFLGPTYKFDGISDRKRRELSAEEPTLVFSAVPRIPQQGGRHRPPERPVQWPTEAYTAFLEHRR